MDIELEQHADSKVDEVGPMVGLLAVVAECSRRGPGLDTVPCLDPPSKTPLLHAASRHKWDHSSCAKSSVCIGTAPRGTNTTPYVHAHTRHDRLQRKMEMACFDRCLFRLLIFLTWGKNVTGKRPSGRPRPESWTASLCAASTINK